MPGEQLGQVDILQQEVRRRNDKPEANRHHRKQVRWQKLPEGLGVKGVQHEALPRQLCRLSVGWLAVMLEDLWRRCTDHHAQCDDGCQVWWQVHAQRAKPLFL